MRRVLALVLFAGALCAGDVHGQGVGSWRNSPPGSKAIHYDVKGRRIYWDANGFVVGHYDFRTRRFVSLLEAQAAKEASPGAPTPSPTTTTAPRRRWNNPQRLAIVYRGGARGYGRAASSAATGPKVIITGNFATGNIVRHERRPPTQPNVAQAPAEFTTSNMP